MQRQQDILARMTLILPVKQSNPVEMLSTQMGQVGNQLG